MFRFAFFLVLSALSAFAPPLAAQMAFDAGSATPQSLPTTEARDIAMIYYRFARLAPPVDRWAEETEAYKNAPAFDKEIIRRQQAAALQQAFDLLGLNERIVAQLPLILSDYSLSNKGYLAENLSADTVFRFSYAGETFIVVPRGIQDRDWLPVEGLAAKTLDDLRASSASGREASATLSLAPRFAEAAPVEVDGVPSRVMSADILDMVFFDKKGNVAWRNKILTEDPNAKVRQNELLELYR